MRTILHSDLNNCFAGIESIAHPEYKKIPFAVGGDEEMRHGVILAKNDIAKKYGIKTGEPLVSARRKCPDLKIVQPHFELYNHYCNAVRSLYYEYTDRVEPFGLDESWLDTTGSEMLFGDGVKIADEIRRRVRQEFGLTVSVGVSYNKIFAKLGSDYKKPDAVTVITPANYQNIVWKQPVENLLFVGSSTAERLHRSGIRTIGDLATASENFLSALLGKNGVMLRIFANGLDDAPVRRACEAEPIKSISNSTTTPRDMMNIYDAKIILHMLAEQVCRRLRSQHLKCSEVGLHLRRNDLYTFERQSTLSRPSNTSGDIFRAAMTLLEKHYNFTLPLRSIGIRTGKLTEESSPTQLSFSDDEQHIEKLNQIDILKDTINQKYGKNSLYRAVLMSDKTLFFPEKPTISGVEKP